MKLEIRAVKIRARLREDLGNLDGLAASIRDYGLIHPIVVDEDNVLVAGQRRVAACKSIGLTTIDARRFGELTPAERRVIELEENLHRKDLTPYEKSKAGKDLADASREVAKEEAKANGNSGQRGQGSTRGPVARMDSNEAIAERIGVPRKTLERAEQHVSYGEKYPLLTAPDWSQRAALKVGKLLDEIPAKDRNRIIKLCEQELAHAAAAEKIIATWAELPEAARERSWEIVHAPDYRDQAIGLGFLAKLAPDIDPRLTWFGSASKECRRLASRFKDDPDNDRILKAADVLADVAQLLRDRHKARVDRITKEIMG